MRQIPKRAHFYWGGTVLPFLRYMTLWSFRRFNPDWEMNLFVPKDLNANQTWATHENKEKLNTEDYFERVKELGVNIATWDPIEQAQFPPNLPEVIKSDILRLHLLSTIGGLWSDLDIVYFRPVEHALKPTGHQSYFCYRRGGPTQDPIPKNGPLYHSIGFLLGRSANPHFRKLLEGARLVLNAGEYQSVGSPFYGQTIDMLDPTIFNLDIATVYPSRAAHNLFTDPSDHHIYEIRDLSCGFHWYGGAPNSGKWQNILIEQNYAGFDNIICWLLRKILRGENI